MIEQLTIDTDDRGQVGIGTLIIFIALVLVSAVAAGVLIDTSGQLESRASDTGEDAQAQVSNQIDVVSATGVDTASPTGIETIELVVKKSPGSDPIDLNDTTIQYQSGSSVETLTFAGTSGSADATQFATETIDGGSAILLDDNDERVKIVISAKSIEGGDLPEGSNVQLEIVDQSGASTVYGVNVPDVLTGDYVSV
jgi:flagellin-like protein